MARPLEPLVPEVLWSNRRNSGSGDCRQIGIFAHCTASIDGQTTKIVALATTDKSVSPTIIPPSIKYFDVLFWGYALDIYILFTISERLDHVHVWMFCVSTPFFFWTSAWCTVHGTWTIHQGIWTMFFNVNNNQKLFFYYFQFSIFSKISGIQTHPYHGEWYKIWVKKSTDLN